MTYIAFLFLTHKILTFTQIDNESWALTPEGQDLVSTGSHEAKFYNAVPESGIDIKTLQGLMGAAYGFGQGKAFKNKWVKKDGANIVRIVCFSTVLILPRLARLSIKHRSIYSVLRLVDLAMVSRTIPRES